MDIPGRSLPVEDPQKTQAVEEIQSISEIVGHSVRQ
jgi:hypothetical protein